MPVLLTVLVFAAGCKDKSESDRSGAVSDPAPELEAVPPADEAPEEAFELHDFAHGGDEVAALARIGSLPAWSAVTERYRLLGRRSQEGAVHGLVLEHEQDGLLRLVDDTIGQGALSIPISLPEGLEIEPATRVILWGAWQLEGAEQGNGRQWIWHATRAERLDDEPGPRFSPGLHARIQDPPDDLVPASAVSRRGGAIAFTVLEASERVGDGWLIADPGKAEPVARLILLGEIESYGAQSSPGPTERWQLHAGQQYWLEIGRFRPASGDSLPVYQASSLPFLLDPDTESADVGGPE